MVPDLPCHAEDGRTVDRRTLAAAVAGVAGIAGYAALRSRMNDWGATRSERGRPLAGDEAVPDPNYQTTRAVTVDAPPDAVWPWVARLGAGRGGLYSYDWLDVLSGVSDEPSATGSRSDHQRLEAGDVVSLGDGGDLRVEAVEPGRALVTVPEAFTAGTLAWTFVLEPLEGERTRLLTRNRGRFEWSPRLLARLAVLEPAAFVMTRRTLLGIKARAERAHGAGADESSTP